MSCGKDATTDDVLGYSLEIRQNRPNEGEDHILYRSHDRAIYCPPLRHGTGVSSFPTT